MAFADYKLPSEVLFALEECLECGVPGTLQVDDPRLPKLHWCCECMARFIPADIPTDEEDDHYIKEVDNVDTAEVFTAAGQQASSSQLSPDSGKDVSASPVEMLGMTIRACPNCGNDNLNDVSGGVTIKSEDEVQCGNCCEVWKFELNMFQKAPVWIDCTKCEKEQVAVSFYKIGTKLNAICVCRNEYIVYDEEYDESEAEAAEGKYQCERCTSFGPFVLFDSENGLYTIAVCRFCEYQMVVDETERYGEHVVDETERYNEPGKDPSAGIPRKGMRDWVKEKVGHVAGLAADAMKKAKVRPEDAAGFAIGLLKKTGDGKGRSAMLQGGGILAGGMLGIAMEKREVDKRQLPEEEFERRIMRRIEVTLKATGSILIMFIPHPSAKKAAVFALPFVAEMIGQPLGKFVARKMAPAE